MLAVVRAAVQASQIQFSEWLQLYHLLNPWVLIYS